MFASQIISTGTSTRIQDATSFYPSFLFFSPDCSCLYSFAFFLSLSFAPRKQLSSLCVPAEQRRVQYRYYTIFYSHISLGEFLKQPLIAMKYHFARKFGNIWPCVSSAEFIQKLKEVYYLYLYIYIYIIYELTIYGLPKLLLSIYVHIYAYMYLYERISTSLWSLKLFVALRPTRL